MFKHAFLVCAIAIVTISCAERQTDEQEPPLARAHAEQFLEHLRLQEWSRAADFVLVNGQALNRFALPPDADRSAVPGLVAELFREVYENQPPGAIVDVRLDADGPGSTNRVFVTYRHGDFDSFYMRLVDDRWQYSFE